MSNPTTVDPIFLNGCLNAIDMMRKARMDDALIANVLHEIRAAAIGENERHRNAVQHENPIALPRPSDLLRALPGSVYR